MFAAAKPRTKATGGEINPETQTSSNTTKMSCCSLRFIVKKVKSSLGQIVG